ncbi:MAG: dihydrofolate reductase [Bacteroidales bacterium]
MLSIIVAISSNLAIGIDNDMPWHLSADLKYFKKTTLGHRIIMGRKTFESVKCRPLPKRENIIISRTSDYPGVDVKVVRSINEALKLCPKGEESFICGGSQIYNETLNIVDRLYLTRIHKSFEANSFFPEIDFNQWRKIKSTHINNDESVDFEYTFEVWERK